MKGNNGHFSATQDGILVIKKLYQQVCQILSSSLGLITQAFQCTTQGMPELYST